MKNEEKNGSANSEALSRFLAADPVLVGCGLAGEVVDGFKKNMILHSGPPVKFFDMRAAHKSGVTGAARFEGLADSEAEVAAKIESGEIILAEANDYNSGGPGTGITSYSMAVLVVEERTSGIKAVAAPVEGECGGGLGGWGVYDEKIDANLKKISGCYAPLLDKVLTHCGGLSVKSLFAAGLSMGDEEHSRQVATDKLFVSRMLDYTVAAPLSDGEKLELMAWLNSCKRFVHHIGTATAVASLKSAAGVEGSSMVTAMCGNGVEFGIKVSATGEKWYTAPAPGFKGRYFSSEYSDADGAPWLGDSSNVEAYGLGGMSAAAAPVLLQERGSEWQEGVKQTGRMRRICLGENPAYPLPLQDGRGAPAGIDAGLVLETGVTPVMHGGILSKDSGGQIGVGYANTPLECFAGAMQNFK